MNVFSSGCRPPFDFEDPNNSRDVILEKSSANFSIRSYIADLSVVLLYRNQSKSDIEFSYTLPVDEKCSLYEFKATIQEKIITAVCLEREEAKKKYVEAVRKGKKAILGAEDSRTSDFFCIALGNLPPNEVATITIKMVMELPVEADGAFTFVLPSVFHPRYAPEECSAGPDKSMPKSASKTATPLNSCLDINGDVRGPLRIARISCDEDSISVQMDDDDMTAVISQLGITPGEKDWNIRVYYASAGNAASVLQMAGQRDATSQFMGDDAIMISVFPEVPIDAFSPHNEIIFFVDRSGSMGGDRMEKAKSALLLFLKSLPPGCRFNILSFGNSFDLLFEKSERYTKDTLKKAMKLLESMDADMGGTEILEALRHVYSLEQIPGYARQLMVLTDGAVWNVSEVTRLASANAHSCRVFSLGIGDGASSELVRTIADVSGGRSEMVLELQDLQMKVMGLLASLLQDNAYDVRVTCDTAPHQHVTVIPEVTPVLFGGQHLILYAKVQPKTKLNSVKISWTLKGKTESIVVNGDDCKIVHDSNFSFHRLAAKAQLKQWQRLQSEEKNADIISLSTSTNVLSKLTSFVGIDQDDKPVTQIKEAEEEFEGHFYSQAQQDCGVSTRATKSLFKMKRKTLPERLSGVMMQKSMMSRQPMNFCSKQKVRGPSRQPRHLSYDVDDDDDSPNGKKKLQSDPLLKIVELQDFDGSWGVEDCLKIVKVSEQQINKLQTELSILKAALGTCVCVALLRHHFSSRNAEWTLIERKAIGFLRQCNVADPEGVIEMCKEKVEEWPLV